MKIFYEKMPEDVELHCMMTMERADFEYWFRSRILGYVDVSVTPYARWEDFNFLVVEGRRFAHITWDSIAHRFLIGGWLIGSYPLRTSEYEKLVNGEHIRVSL